MSAATCSSDAELFDVVVVGTGFGGLNALYRFREQGRKVVALEAAADVGGTWYWNKYPGARVDIESLEYSYGFLDDIQQEWSWSMRWAEQPEVLRYLRWVADRLDLRPNIELNSRVNAAVFDEAETLWTLTTEHGKQIRARHCVLSVGFLSEPHLPAISGLDRFDGTLVHTSTWPEAGVDLAGRRVGVIGVGASGVQLIPIIARQAAHLTVYQRTPNWCFPITNGPLSDEYEGYVKSHYPEVRRHEYETMTGVALVKGRMREFKESRSLLDVPDDERLDRWEYLWPTDPSEVFRSYPDILTNIEANKKLQEFIERKIRERIEDPQIARKLIPDHPVMARRPPGETSYYETYNRTNVSLVSTLQDPIVECTTHGIRLQSGEEHQLDVIVCATGFDAGAGALLRIDIVGRGGKRLADHWALGVRTHLGMMTTGFPNLFFINGVQSPAALFSPPLLAEYQNRLVARLIDDAHAKHARTIEPTDAAQTAWVERITQAVNATLIPRGNGWWIGANIPGKERRPVMFVGGFAAYHAACEEALTNLQEFELDVVSEDVVAS